VERYEKGVDTGKKGETRRIGHEYSRPCADQTTKKLTCTNHGTSSTRLKNMTKKNKISEQVDDNITVAPAWTITTNEITCRNHEKESTTNAYLLCLQARIVEFRMASKKRCDGGAK
jgi:hypothetical protein